MPAIDGDRLLKDLYAVREIGKFKTGVHRPTFSPQDVEARHWLSARLTGAGLDASIDGIGNVYGRDPRPDGSSCTGSHIETQNHAGWLDGAMGVIYGLETARTLGRGIDVAAWADEEGHFGSFLGSRSFCGLLTEQEIDVCANRETGMSLRDALRQAGFSGRPRQTDRSSTLPRLPGSPYRARRRPGRPSSAPRHRHRHRRQPAVPHPLQGPAEPRRHHPHGGAQGRRRRTGETRRRDRGSASRRSPAPARSGRQATSSSTPAPPASCRAAPNWCSSSAIPIRPSWTRWTRRSTNSLAEAAKGPCEVTIAYRGTTAPSAMDPGFQRALRRRSTPRPGPAPVDAVRRRPRRPDPGAGLAVGHAVRAEHRRHQPPLRRKYPRRRHRSRLPGIRRRGSVNARQGVAAISKIWATLLRGPLRASPKSL